MAKRIIYHPPSLSTIGRLVDQVFDQFSEQGPLYTRPEVRAGFTRFLWHVAIVLAKHLSETDGQDNTIDNSLK
jgi:hypothetical protein